MAVTLKQNEAVPAAYPDVTPYLGDDFVSDDPVQNRGVTSSLIWQRIEAHIAHRWTPRQVVWLVEAEGGDEWQPPLTPVVSATGECWNENTLDWETVGMTPDPLGYLLAYDATYRITAIVGGGEVPELVLEAFRRLHEYSIGIAQQFQNEAAYTEGMAFSWPAKALQLSGAADLLRNYRRA